MASIKPTMRPGPVRGNPIRWKNRRAAVSQTRNTILMSVEYAIKVDIMQAEHHIYEPALRVSHRDSILRARDELLAIPTSQMDKWGLAGARRSGLFGNGTAKYDKTVMLGECFPFLNHEMFERIPLPKSKKIAEKGLVDLADLDIFAPPRNTPGILPPPPSDSMGPPVSDPAKRDSSFPEGVVNLEDIPALLLAAKVPDVARPPVIESGLPASQDLAVHARATLDVRAPLQATKPPAPRQKLRTLDEVKEEYLRLIKGINLSEHERATLAHFKGINASALEALLEDFAEIFVRDTFTGRKFFKVYKKTPSAIDARFRLLLGLVIYKEATRAQLYDIIDSRADSLLEDRLRRHPLFKMLGRLLFCDLGMLLLRDPDLKH